MQQKFSNLKFGKTKNLFLGRIFCQKKFLWVCCVAAALSQKVAQKLFFFSIGQLPNSSPNSVQRNDRPKLTLIRLVLRKELIYGSKSIRKKTSP